MLSDLPAIFPLDLTDDGLQVAQGATAWLGACKTRRQARMQVEQAQGPAANVAWGWPGLCWCGIIMGLHVVLVSDGQRTQESFRSSSVSHRRAKSTKFLLIRGIFPGKCSAYKCHCSVACSA